MKFSLYKQVFILLFLLLGGQAFFAQTAPNKPDRKGNKHGLWKDTIDYNANVLCVAQGRYDHGQKTGTWKTTILWTAGFYWKNSIITEPYTSGKKNGWAITYQWPSHGEGDTVLAMRMLYRDDSLIEEMDYVVVHSLEDFERKGVIPETHLYLDGETIVMTEYYSDFLEDSSKIKVRSCWVSYGHAGGLSRTGYPRPSQPKRTTIDEYYRSGQLEEHKDSMFWINRYVRDEYYENGQVKSRVRHNGAILPVQRSSDPPYPMFTYYKNDVVCLTRRPDTLMPRIDTTCEFDTRGRPARTTYGAYRDSAQFTVIDSIYSAGVLSSYTIHTSYLNLTRCSAKYYPSGKIQSRKYLFNGDTSSVDTSYYESGAIEEVWIRVLSARYTTHIEYAEDGQLKFYAENNKQFSRVIRFSKPGHRSEAIWMNDSLRFDTVYYESGKLKETCEGRDRNNRKCVTRYENGAVKTIETWTNGVLRKEEYDEKGRLIK